MAEELTRSEETCRNDGSVGFQPRENDLTFEQTPYVLTALALAVDDLAMGERQATSIGTGVG